MNDSTKPLRVASSRWSVAQQHVLSGPLSPSLGPKYHVTSFMYMRLVIEVDKEYKE